MRRSKDLICEACGKNAYGEAGEARDLCDPCRQGLARTQLSVKELAERDTMPARNYVPVPRTRGVAREIMPVLLATPTSLIPPGHVATANVPVPNSANQVLINTIRVRHTGSIWFSFQIEDREYFAASCIGDGTFQVPVVPNILLRPHYYARFKFQSNQNVGDLLAIGFVDGREERAVT